MYRRIIALTLLACAGCVTEAGHTLPTTLPTGKPGYVITCNSNRYDRCLSRAARACAGAYTIIPQARSSTFRPADAMPGVGNGESILVSCEPKDTPPTAR
jgi:hypothetical protein